MNRKIKRVLRVIAGGRKNTTNGRFQGTSYAEEGTFVFRNCSHPCGVEFASQSELDGNQRVVTLVGHCLQIA